MYSVNARRNEASPNRMSLEKHSCRREPTVRRQLFFPVSDNYFSRSTTITPEAPRSGALRRRAVALPSARFDFERGTRGGGKVGNPLLVFHFPTRPRRRSCGNVGISPAVGEISKGLVERVGSQTSAFHAFHSSGISTALFAPVFVVHGAVTRCPPAVSFSPPPRDNSVCSAR
jgi:hypothetical protein